LQSRRDPLGYPRVVAVTRDGLPKLVLAGAAAAPALLLFRALVLLRELWRHDAGRDALLPVAAFAAASALAAFLLLLARRLPAASRTNVALAVASAAVAAYGAELALGVGPEAVEGRLAGRLRAADAMGGHGKAVYPMIEPVRFVWARPADAPSSLTVDGVPTLPLAGRARSRLVACQEEEAHGGWRAYESDEHGFMNPPSLWARAPVALAAVGDSFTAGSCVPPESSMVAVLRRRFPDAVNLGVAGDGPLMMLAVVREYLPALRPREVLWCHFAGNDLLDLRRERGHALLRRYLEDGFRQGLLERQDAIDHALDDYLERHLRPALERRVVARRRAADVLALRGLRSRLGLVFADPHALRPTDEEYALLGGVLERARETVKAWGGALRFVYLPAGTPRWHVARAAEAAVTAEEHARILSLVRALGIPVIDVQDAFAAQPGSSRLFACPDCHYTVAGYHVAADAILAGLGETARP
jgi:GDSL-like lipase/acylhydrolase family protein